VAPIPIPQPKDLDRNCVEFRFRKNLRQHPLPPRRKPHQV
jgi:hypothetical protein